MAYESMTEIMKVHEISTFGEHLPRTKTVNIFREILPPTAKLIFSSSYTCIIWFKISVCSGLLKSKCQRKQNGLCDVHHLIKGNMPFNWECWNSTSADSTNFSLHYFFWNGIRLHSIWYLQQQVNISNDHFVWCL